MSWLSRNGPKKDGRDCCACYADFECRSASDVEEHEVVKVQQKRIVAPDAALGSAKRLSLIFGGSTYVSRTVG